MVEQLVIIGILFVVFLFIARRASRKGVAAVAGPGRVPENGEALFQSMFPDLQPLFHPEKLAQYVAARRGRQPPKGGFTWKNPPGFPAAAAGEIQLADGRERVRLVDAAGALLGEFLFEEQPAGGVLRMGRGKFTVDIRDRKDPRVRYWHPEREFGWSRAKGWRFTTPMADRTFDTDSGGTSFSSPSMSGSSAGEPAFAGQGGTFDGGGASGGWDDPGSGSGSGASGSGDSAGASTTSY